MKWITRRIRQLYEYARRNRETGAARPFRPSRWGNIETDSRLYLHMDRMKALSKSSKLVVYVAGPYRSATIRGTVCNIRRAEALAAAIWQMDMIALCPHTNSALLDGLEGVTDDDWLQGTMELMRRADAVCLVSGWEESEGTRGEVIEADLCGMPIYEQLPDHNPKATALRIQSNQVDNCAAITKAREYTT